VLPLTPSPLSRTLAPQVSIWTYVLARADQFLNKRYAPSSQPVWPSTSMKKLQLWSRYYSRWDPDVHPRHDQDSDLSWHDDWGSLAARRSPPRAPPRHGDEGSARRPSTAVAVPSGVGPGFALTGKPPPPPLPPGARRSSFAAPALKPPPPPAAQSVPEAAHCHRRMPSVASAIFKPPGPPTAPPPVPASAAAAPPPPVPAAAPLPPPAPGALAVEAEALYAYAGDGSDWQLASMNVGDHVKVHEQNDDGWWKVTVLTAGAHCGNAGMVPASYLALR